MEYYADGVEMDKEHSCEIFTPTKYDHLKRKILKIKIHYYFIPSW